jgi:hypothetical protein
LVSLKETGDILLPVDTFLDTYYRYQLAGMILFQKEKNHLKPLKQKAFTNISNMTNTEGSISLGIEKVKGEFKAEVSGVFNPYYKLVQDPESIKDYIASHSEYMSISDANINQLEPDKMKCSYSITIDKADENVKQINFPIPIFHDALELVYHHPIQMERTTALQLPYPVSQKSSINIQYPQNWKYIGPDKQQIKENRIGKVKISIDKRNTKIQVVREIELTKTDISPAEYQDFVELWRIWRNQRYRELVFLKK